MTTENNFEVPHSEDPDVQAFYEAIIKGDVKTLKHLYNGDRISNLNAKDKDGRTPLHYASAFGRILSVKFLLDRGANKDVEDRFGKKPIDYAERNGYREVVELLL